MKFSEPSTVALSKTRRASSYQQRLGSFRSLTLDRVGSSVHSTTAISCFSNQTSVISSTSLPSTKKLVPAGTAPILNDRRWDLCRSNARPMLRGLGPGRALCLDRLSTVDVWHLWADKRRGPREIIGAPGVSLFGKYLEPIRSIFGQNDSSGSRPSLSCLLR